MGSVGQRRRSPIEEPWAPTGRVSLGEISALSASAPNVWARLRGAAGEPLSQVLQHTGTAVALCSLTTIIGYSSLLLSHNRALRSFGLLADLGELTCLAAALLVLPAMVGFARRRAE